MKVLAFNSSPRMQKGVTDKILQTFMDGAKYAGADTETVYLTKKNIKYCIGCFNCWFVHPGKCIHDDDMPEIRKQIRDADLIVFGSPVYFDGFTAQMKTMLDRLIAGGMPFIQVRDGHFRHPSRGGEKKVRKMLLVSTCGFGEKDNFDPIIAHMKAIAKNFATGEYMGALVRPVGSTLEMLQDENPDGVQGVLDAFYQSGVDAVSKGVISKELQEAVSVPLIPLKEFMERANKMFLEMIDQKKTSVKK